mmetsp:Transcript_33856/g.101964  ORF Transcript_33856/g.101964 Transcript_33856/m.101964 type:complete len:317 (+) Transcript_33856:152-1102(+)
MAARFALRALRPHARAAPAASFRRRQLCAPAASEKVTKICDEVCQLNVLELTEFLELFKARAGLSDADLQGGGGGVMMAAPAAAAAAAETPEEVSGLVVLRVAQVADFQEKLLRAVASGADLGVPVTPQQFVFGTELLIRNSNLDGNIKLMIREEVRPEKKTEALERAPRVMNSLLSISTDAAGLADAGKSLLDARDAARLADRYADFRRELLLLFATLPSDTQKRYSGYADALLAYEKDVSRDCKGGAAGGCLEEERPAPASGARPKAGQAPKELEAALAAAAGGETSPPPAPEPWSPPPYKPARGSFAEMAGRY